MALTMAQTYAYARQAGFDPAAAIIAAAIAMGESGLNPKALGDTSLEDGKWGPSVGLMQVRTLKAETGKGTPRDITKLTDPVQNMAAAYGISNKGRDWSPWTVYTSGKYRQYLGQAESAAGGAGGSVPGATVTPVGFLDETAADVGRLAKDTGLVLLIAGLGVVLLVAGAAKATGMGGALGGLVSLAPGGSLVSKAAK